MIFVTVGTQLPFPRLVGAMDAFASDTTELVIAQTGMCREYPNLLVEGNMSSTRYRDVLADARIVISHAGIGSVLAAREAAKPLIVVPRRADLREHRNDHQVDTARRLVGRDGIDVLWDVAKLPKAIARLHSAPSYQPAAALEPLVDELRRFIG